VDIATEISKVSLVFERNEVTISEVKREVDRANIPLENMDRRAGRHLQTFLDVVGEACVFQDVNLKRVEGTANVFSRDKQEKISDAKEFLEEKLENFSSLTLNAAIVLTA